MIYSSLIYLIGHEFSHHKFHDYLFTVTPSEQVTKEKRADVFAFRKMVTMDYAPMAAMPVLVFFLGVEGFSPETSPNADHPAAVLRFEDMIEATKSDSEFMNLIRQHHMEVQWNAFTALATQFNQNSNASGHAISAERGSNSFASTGAGAPSDNDQCNDIQDYAQSALQRFRSLKGPVDSRDSEGVTYRTTHGIAGFSDCTVETYADRSLGPSAVCEGSQANLDDLWNTIRGCFPGWIAGHRSLSAGEQYELTGPNGVSVRLRSSTNRIKLWVDAPE